MNSEKSLLRDRAVYVVGIGLHPYAFPTQTSYVQLGLHAIREALTDAGIQFSQVQSAVVGTAALGMAAGRVMLQHLGSTGLEVLQVENASASGSTAFRLACLQVASGQHEVALAIGVDKFGDGRRAVLKDGLQPLSPTTNVPLVKYALLARKYEMEQRMSKEDMARVAVKNHGNASRNPYAQFRKPRTLDQVLSAAPVAGDLTALQCCPRGEGAAAVVVASEYAIKRMGIPKSRAIKVLASYACSETIPETNTPSMVNLVRNSTKATLEQASVGPEDLDIVELHDAFTIEEILYTEAIGVCGEGDGPAYIKHGHADIGGRCAVNPSGGLIGMGHPLGPTGIGQIAEITRQLRGEAEGRQHTKPRVALAHMIGLGAVAVVHVFTRA